MSRFETYKDKNGDYRWRLIGLNGEIVGASSEGFENESYILENAKKVMLGISEYLKEKNKLKNIINTPKGLPIKPKFNLFDFNKYK